MYPRAGGIRYPYLMLNYLPANFRKPNGAALTAKPRLIFRISPHAARNSSAAALAFSVLRYPLRSHAPTGPQGPSSVPPSWHASIFCSPPVSPWAAVPCASPSLPALFSPGHAAAAARLFSARRLLFL